MSFQEVTVQPVGPMSHYLTSRLNSQLNTVSSFSLSSTPFSIFLFPKAEGGHHESVRQPVLPLDPAVPSNLSATPRFGRNRAEAADKEAMGGTDAGPPAWPDGKVFAEAKTAVWTEAEAGVHTGAGGKVFAETGIMTGTGAWAEVGAEWRPVEREGSDLPSMPKEPAAWLEQQKLQTRAEGQRDQAAFSSVLTMLAETAELQAPAVGKPLGLLSKAAWTRSSSSSSSKTSSSSSSSTTKASSLASSSSSSTAKASSLPSSSSPVSNRDVQTAGSDSPVALNSNSSNINSSASLGMMMCCLSFRYSSIFDFLQYNCYVIPLSELQLPNHSLARTRYSRPVMLGVFCISILKLRI